jgi:hypothetical protein
MRRRAFLKGAGVAGGAAVLGLAPRSLRAGGAKPAPLDRLARARIALGVRLQRHEGSRAVTVVDVPLGAHETVRRDLGGAAWACRLRSATPVKARPDAVEIVAAFKLERGRAPEASVGLTLAFDAWSPDDYVFLPGAVYAGNRFESRHTAYPPLLTEPADIGPNVPTIVSDIPRLNVHAGLSRVQLLTSDLATPAVGIHLPDAAIGVLVLADPATPAGPTGITVEEADDRTRATLIVAAPGVRENVPYAAGSTRQPSKDRGASFRAGDEITVRVRVHVFECADVPSLHERFFAVRKDLTGPSATHHALPFSAAFKVHEDRTAQRWNEGRGYFAVGARDSAYSNWQTGWCGGLATTLPLLEAGGATSRERALRNIDFALSNAQAPSGFFHGVYDGETWFEDGFAAPRTRAGGGAPPPYKHARRWHLVRRSADALTLLARQLLVLEHQERDRPFKPDAAWTKAIGRCADAFVRVWDRYRQLGQYVNIDTGEIVVGGSTGAALAPAGLALAAAVAGKDDRKDDYLRVAKAAAQQMYERYVRAGYTTGAPGDALQCPDSQSALALCDSFVTLHEQTGDRVWAERATAAAHLLATWVISHDHHPLAGGDSDAPGVLRTTGAVLSDAQHKRGSPGYVLASGDALLRLYRATGEIALLELLRDTVHNMAQYLPRAEGAARARDAAPVPPAQACARADTSDWLDDAGGIVPTLGVYDTSSLLAYAEIPGLYVQTDGDVVFAFDHVDATVKERSADGLIVTLTNPTHADAVVRVLAETTADAAHPLAPGAVAASRAVPVPAGGTADVDLKRSA